MRLECFIFGICMCFYSFLALRLRGAVLEIVYTKLLRVRSLKDKTVGHVSDNFSNNIFQEIVSF